MLDKFKSKLSELFNTGGGGKKENSQSEKVKSNKTGISSTFLSNILIVFLVGVLLLIVGSIFTPSKKSSTKEKGATSVASVGDEVIANVNEESGSAVKAEYKKKMEDELISTLEKIENVGKVHAMIYFEGGAEQVPVFNQNTSNSTTSETDTSGGKREVTQENGGSTVVMENKENEEKPFIIKTYNPNITGICVVSEGAGDSVTELRIRQAVTRLFGLEDSKVQVYPMQK